MAATVRAAFAIRICRRLFSISSSPTSTLLGHFFHPVHPQDPTAFEVPPSSPPAFAPLTTSSPRLSLDFVPDVASFVLYDSHLGLLLLRQKLHAPISSQRASHLPPPIDLRRFMVCDPTSRLQALLPPPPITRLSGGQLVGAALLSRTADQAGNLCCEVVCITVDVDRPRAWIASLSKGRCRWSMLPPSPEVTVDFDTIWFERISVRAAGSLYWHVCNNASALALNTATMRFSFVRAPKLMWDPSFGIHKYRFGELPEDGQLCVASLELQGLFVCVRDEAKHMNNGWVLVKHTPMTEVLYKVPWLPRYRKERQACMWLSDIDGGRTGNVFIHTLGYGAFSYHMSSGKVEHLVTPHGMTYGHPIFPYFSAP